MVSTSQQVGGSIGVEGDAFGWAAAIFAVGALVTALLLRSGVRVAAADGAPEAVAQAA